LSKLLRETYRDAMRIFLVSKLRAVWLDRRRVDDGNYC